jgi:hypothetical protein
MFMRCSQPLNPESLANERQAVQIVDTLKALDTVLITDLVGVPSRICRTAAMRADE